MKRSNFRVCMQLIRLVRPLTGWMVLAITAGLLGHLCAAAIPVLGGAAFLQVLGLLPAPLTGIMIAAAVCAVLRGALHYGEQGCNHYIAFKLLALIRDRVFSALRRLCPAKLEGRDRGDLISLITSDIELLEVFYAHTISPAAIALLFSLLVCAALWLFHPVYALIAAAAFVCIGVLIPLWISRRSVGLGQRFRDEAGALSAFVLDSLRGLPETLQYARGTQRLEEIESRTESLSDAEQELKEQGGTASAVTTAAILCFDLLILFAGAALYLAGRVGFAGVLLPVITLMSAFGPVIALANLGSGLQNTFAAGNRVLDLLEEAPETPEITGKTPRRFSGAEAKDVCFSYGGDAILQEVSAVFPENTVIGVTGKSGSGKSTLLKLLMRFWKVQKGEISFGDASVEEINTADLRDMQGFVTQETHLFHDSIASNLRVAKPDATQKELEDACRRASVHDFICTLPQGYDTPVGELGSTLSGGERQRLGLARAFLHDAPMLLLDEPTSNLDSLNEAVILRSIEQSRKGKTVVLVSHRASTMALADRVYSVEHGRIS